MRLSHSTILELNHSTCFSCFVVRALAIAISKRHRSVVLHARDFACQFARYSPFRNYCSRAHQRKQLGAHTFARKGAECAPRADQLIRSIFYLDKI